MFRKLLYAFILMSVVMVAIFGWRKVRANVVAARDSLEDQLDDYKGQTMRAKEIRQLIQDFGKSVDEYSARIADIDDQARDAEQELAQLRGQAQDKLAVLKQAKDLLQQGDVQFVIGGRTWSREAVSDDALSRAGEFQRLQAAIAGKEKALAQLRAGAAEAKSNLDKARVAQSKLNDELADLETRLENAQMLGNVRQTMASISVPDGPSSELRGAMDRLRLQVRRAEIVASGSPADSSPHIDYVNHSRQAMDILTTVIGGADSNAPKALFARPATQPTETAESR